MKRILLLIVILLFSIPAYAQSIKIGYFEAAPYIFVDSASNSLKGAAFEFLNEKIAPAMGVTFVWDQKATGIPRLIEQLKSNKLDAAAVFAKNPDREKIMDFSKQPYFKTYPVLAVLKDNSLQKIHSIEDVLPLKIGFCAKSFISPFMRDKRIKWDLLSSSTCISQNLKKLTINRFDAQYQPDAPPLLYYARETGVENDIRLVPLPEEVNLYTPFSKAAGAKYLDKYEKALAKVGGVNTYLEFLGKYIDVSKL